jgi:hypothetical protein
MCKIKVKVKDVKTKGWMEGWMEDWMDGQKKGRKKEWRHDTEGKAGKKRK